jgi:hypothetical protein
MADAKYAVYWFARPNEMNIMDWFELSKGINELAVKAGLNSVYDFLGLHTKDYMDVCEIITTERAKWKKLLNKFNIELHKGKFREL